MEFSKEQIEKAKNCKTIEEFKSLAKAEGLNFSDTDAEKYFNATRGGELSDDDLDKVAGGKGWEQKRKFVYYPECPFCGKITKVEILEFENPGHGYKYEWEPKTCTCGASIDYWDSSMNFTYIKNGEVRDAKR